MCSNPKENIHNSIASEEEWLENYGSVLGQGDIKTVEVVQVKASDSSFILLFKIGFWQVLCSLVAVKKKK